MAKLISDLAVWNERKQGDWNGYDADETFVKLTLSYADFDVEVNNDYDNESGAAIRWLIVRQKPLTANPQTNETVVMD